MGSQSFFNLPIEIKLDLDSFEDTLDQLFESDLELDSDVDVDVDVDVDSFFDTDWGFDLDVFDNLLDPLNEAWGLGNDFWDLGNSFWDTYWQSGDSFWSDDWGFDLELWEDSWSDVWNFGFDPWDEFHGLDFDLWDFTSVDFAHPDHNYQPIKLGESWFNPIWKDQLMDWSGGDKIIDFWINKDADSQYAEDNGLGNADGFTPLVDYEVDYLREVFDYLDAITGLSFNEVSDWRDSDVNISFSPDLSELGFSDETIGYASFEEPKRRIDLFVRSEDGWFDDYIPNEANVILHEIGHALGLAHPDHHGDGFNPDSSTSKTIMSYNDDGFYGFTESDIEALQHLWDSEGHEKDDAEAEKPSVSLNDGLNARVIGTNETFSSESKTDLLTGADSDSLIMELQLDLTQIMRGKTAFRESVLGDDEDNVIAAGKGNDRLTGGGGADAFLFHRRKRHGKKSANVIVDFSSLEGDLIVFNRKFLKGLDHPQFAVASSRKELRTYFREDADIIYLSSKGRLFYDANGDGRGNGRGGLIAKLIGKPELSVDSFGFLQN